MYSSQNKNLIQESFFHLLILESVNYILNKNIENKQKSHEIEEIGQHLGERISNHLLNQGNNYIKMEIDEVMKFLGRDVWSYCFCKQISKLQTNRKGTFLFDCEELKFHSNLIFTKNSSQTTNKIDFILQLICGIIKGVISFFNMECNVSAVCRQNVIFNNLLSLTSDNVPVPENMNASNVIYPYSFTINIINTNN